MRVPTVFGLLAATAFLFGAGRADAACDAGLALDDPDPALGAAALGLCA
jgi:hypothetical protein